ncbi:hypothetical protein ACEK07_30380 [Alcanivoracaceae bacterium MT1]
MMTTKKLGKVSWFPLPYNSGHRNVQGRLGAGLILGLTTLGSSPVQALKTDFGMEYRATAFALQSSAFENAGGESDTDNGLGHLVRVKANFLDEDTGISVRTSIELAGDRWVGDDHDTGSNAPSFNTTSRGDNVRLDLGYVQIPLSKVILHVGRVASSFNHCFISCDDRHDTLLVFGQLGRNTTLFAEYYRVNDTSPFQSKDNGGEVDVGVISKFNGIKTGLLYGVWENSYDSGYGTPDANGYDMSGVNLLTGYVSGDIGHFTATAGFNWFGGGNVKYRDGDGKTTGQVFSSDSPAAYLRLVRDSAPWQFGLQVVGVWDGGYVSPGFDTWSSMLNSNPTATNNPTSLYAIGQGFGLKGFDQNLIATKIGFDVTPKLNITGAVGRLHIDNHGKLSYTAKEQESSMVYDLRFTYKVRKGVKLWWNLGYLEKNRAAEGLHGNGLSGVGSVATFDEDAKATSLNLTVDF